VTEPKTKPLEAWEVPADLEELDRLIQHRIKRGMSRERRRLFSDPRALLAVIALAGAIAMGVINLALGGDGEVPAWVVAMSTAVITFYFGARASNGHPHGEE
jgi:hypothetical protein